MTTSKGKGQGSASKAPRDAAASLGHGALLEALRTLLEPIAALAVARGVPYAEVDEIVKRAFVDAARAAQPGDAGSRLVSRISTATGLNRREVTRLSTAEAAREAPKRSSATQVFTRWVAEASVRPSLRTLARQGPAPSFEALARSVTNDVHPRSLLDELCRLGLARVDSAEDDTVQLVHESFVPKDDRERMFGFLGANVGDHLRAAVGNVMSSEPVHLEQAMFADELSRESMEAIDTFVRTQWKALMAATVPRVNQQIEADNTKNRQRDQRVRIGMYMYSTTMSDVPTEPPTEAPRKSSPRRR